MAKKGKSGDWPFHIVEGGRIVASPGFANDSGAGTPAAPGRRGEAYGGNVPEGLARPPSAASVYQRFRTKKGKR